MKDLIHWNWWLGDGGLDAGYNNILTRASALTYTLPSGVVLAAQNKFYANTKSVIELLNLCYVAANGTGADNFRLLNWAENSNTFNADYPTAITHSAAGWKGNGTDQYISTNWNASTNGGAKYTQNSACRGAWIYTAAVALVVDGVMTTGARNTMRNQNSLSVHKINQAGTNLAVTLDFSGTGYIALDRADSINVSGYNDLVKTDTTATSAAPVNEEQTIFRAGAAAFGDPVIGLYIAGPHLTEPQHNLLRNNFATYLTEIGL